MASPSGLINFGPYQLDADAGQLLKNGRVVRLKPQPFKLLHLLASRPGEVVTREEIRLQLWGTDTYVDFEQGVNTAIKQIRDALKEDADRPLYVETIPKRGYRFIAPVDPPPVPAAGRVTVPAQLRQTDLNLHKALWLNIAELRLGEVRKRRRMRLLMAALAVGILVMIVAMVAARQ